LFLLGHSCWSYLVSKTTARGLRAKLPLYLALLAGVLPDFDIYFHPFIEHHTITHSLLFLGPICALLTYRYRGLGAALSSGILSHLLTDSLVGTIPIFYPVSAFPIGLNLGIPSIADTLLEMGALAASIGLVFLNGDYVLFTRAEKESVKIALPLVAVVTLTVLFAGDNSLSLTTLAFSRKALTAITLGHVVLISAMSLGVLQGVRGWMRLCLERASPNKSPTRSATRLNDEKGKAELAGKNLCYNGT
jgi:LexA-binding, inner membrane-associated putative hydrolase